MRLPSWSTNHPPAADNHIFCVEIDQVDRYIADRPRHIQNIMECDDACVGLAASISLVELNLELYGANTDGLGARIDVDLVGIEL